MHSGLPKQARLFCLLIIERGAEKPQEIIAIGQPVITTDVPGCRETVIDGVNGFLVPVWDVEALACVMERFIAEPVLIEQMGQNSRCLAEERFDIHKINAIILSQMRL